jgi:energy-coupling factor transporter ATP-binding protein EcfA2
MLKTIRLKNFKLHEDTSIEAAPITVFIGPNNSGKSSIFQALLAHKQAALRWDQSQTGLTQISLRNEPGANEPFLFKEESLVQTGEFSEIVRKGEKSIHLAVTGSLNTIMPSKFQGPISVNFEVQVRDNHVIHHHGAVLWQDAKVEWNWKKGDPTKQNVVQINGGTIYVVPTDRFDLIQGSAQPPQGLSLDESEDFRKFGDFLCHAPAYLLKTVHPISAIRGFEELEYPLPDYPPSEIARLTLVDRATALASKLAYDRNLEEVVSERLQELLKIRIQARLVPRKSARIWAEPSEPQGAHTMFVNEGTGANQLPFILVPIALTPENETILLSEPEAHLHPKGQCELMRMLLTVAKKEDIQFFIETHSEHVLHVILNAIGKGEWEPSQVAIYSFENVNGTAKVSRLEVDEQGGVKGGLPGFFDQSLDELTEYLDTLKKLTA